MSHVRRILGLPATVLTVPVPYEHIHHDDVRNHAQRLAPSLDSPTASNSRVSFSDTRTRRSPRIVVVHHHPNWPIRRHQRLPSRQNLWDRFSRQSALIRYFRLHDDLPTFCSPRAQPGHPQGFSSTSEFGTCCGMDACAAIHNIPLLRLTDLSTEYQSDWCFALIRGEQNQTSIWALGPIKETGCTPIVVLACVGSSRQGGKDAEGWLDAEPFGYIRRSGAQVQAKV